MKMCSDHWEKMRTAIQERGLYHRVAVDGKAAVDRVVAELKGTATKETYDPLMSMNNMFFARALECGGLYLMTVKPDGTEYCPLCEVGLHLGSAEPDEWIKSCADSILTHCKENNLQG